MKILQVLIVTIFLFYAVPSISSDWYVIPGTDIQGDWSRIRFDGAGNVLIWLKFVAPPEDIAHRPDNIKYADYEHTMHLWVVNCKQESYSRNQGIDYGKGGRVITSWSDSDKFRVAIPETPGEAVLKAVCPIEDPNGSKKAQKTPASKNNTASNSKNNSATQESIEDAEFVRKIIQAHPDAKQLLPKVEKWLETQPDFLKSKYNLILDNGSAEEVINLYTVFKMSTIN